MNICFLDIETTGIDVVDDDVVQLGAILVDEELRILKEFTSLIKPFTGRQSNTIARAIHGISDKLLLQSPTETEVLNKFFQDFGTDYFFCGWNLNFDLAFFRKMCHRNNLNEIFNRINHRHLDLQSISKFSKMVKVLPDNLNSLQDYCTYYRIQRMEKHDALQDAYITRKVLQAFLKDFIMKFH